MNPLYCPVTLRSLGLKLLMLSILCIGVMSCSSAVQPPDAPDPVFILDATEIKQGEVTQLNVENVPEDTKTLQASFLGRRYSIFPQKNGNWLGLISVDPLQKPGSYPFVVKNQAGEVVFEKWISVLDARFPKQNIAVSGKMGGLTPEPGELEAINRLKNSLSTLRFWDRHLIAPVNDCMNSPFGVQRLYNGKFSGNYHKGVDQRSPQGRPIRAIAGGKVMIARQFRLHGGTVGVDHGQGLSTIYIHMSRIDVKPGQIVDQGTVLGLVGSTGFATGPHLHWGMYVQGNPVNPVSWVPMTACGS